MVAVLTRERRKSTSTKSTPRWMTVTLKTSRDCRLSTVSTVSVDIERRQRNTVGAFSKYSSNESIVSLADEALKKRVIRVTNRWYNWTLFAVEVIGCDWLSFAACVATNISAAGRSGCVKQSWWYNELLLPLLSVPLLVVDDACGTGCDALVVIICWRHFGRFRGWTGDDAANEARFFPFAFDNASRRNPGGDKRQS